MAGARPSSFKKGGGFLNNVDGVITDYNFTPDGPGDGSAKKKKGDFNPLFCLLSVRVDGADEDVSTHLFVGSADDFEISDDGKTLEPVDDSGGLRANTAFAKLIESLIAAGFPETNLPEDAINYEPIIGTRVRFVQKVDEETTKRLGKRKGKDGKEYNRTDLIVADVLALASAGDGKASKATGKKGGKAGKDESADVEDLAKETLLAILADADDNEIPRAKLTVKVAQKLGMKHPQREEVRKLVYSEDFLSQEDGWSYNAKSKGQIISLS